MPKAIGLLLTSYPKKLNLKVTCNETGIKKAVNTITNGGVIVFPTDTVYGIGCDPYNFNTINLIYKIKKRELDKPFPVLSYSKELLSKIVIFNDTSSKIASKYWPGPVTLVLKLKDEKLKKSMNVKDKLAVRIPNNPCTLAILKECKFLVGTSANLSGEKSYTDPSECYKNLTGFDLFVDGGKISSQGESTVVEINDKINILREGIISKEEILKKF